MQLQAALRCEGPARGLQPGGLQGQARAVVAAPDARPSAMSRAGNLALPLDCWSEGWSRQYVATRRRPRRRSRPHGRRNAADRRPPRAPRHPMPPGRVKGAASSMTRRGRVARPLRGDGCKRPPRTTVPRRLMAAVRLLGPRLFRTASRGRAALPHGASTVAALEGQNAPLPVVRARSVAASPDARPPHARWGKPRRSRAPSPDARTFVGASLGADTHLRTSCLAALTRVAP